KSFASFGSFESFGSFKSFGPFSDVNGSNDPNHRTIRMRLNQGFWRCEECATVLRLRASEATAAMSSDGSDSPSLSRTGEIDSDTSTIEPSSAPAWFRNVRDALLRNRRKHLVFFVLAIRRDDDPDRPPDRFLCALTKHLLRGGIPRSDDAFQILADDR